MPIAVTTAGLCGLVYLTVQQSLRQGANDPQIQLAEDAASALNGGTSVDSVMPSSKVDIANSLAPFLLVYDDSGNIVASSATLNGSSPTFPAGILDYTRQKGEDRVTLQPERGVRVAAVVLHYNNGFVLAGRSLREVEKRESQVEELSGIAMVAIWIATLVIISLGEIIGAGK